MSCKLNHFSSSFLPVLLHNVKGCDSHHIIKQAYDVCNELTEMMPDKYNNDDKNGTTRKELSRKTKNGKEIMVAVKPQIKCIPCSYEQFTSFSIGNVKFIDLFQLMGSSLEELLKKLYKKQDKFKNFHVTQQEYP